MKPPLLSQRAAAAAVESSSLGDLAKFPNYRPLSARASIKRTLEAPSRCSAPCTPLAERGRSGKHTFKVHFLEVKVFVVVCRALAAGCVSQHSNAVIALPVSKAPRSWHVHAPMYLRPLLVRTHARPAQPAPPLHPASACRAGFPALKRRSARALWARGPWRWMTASWRGSWRPPTPRLTRPTSFLRRRGATTTEPCPCSWVGAA